MDDLWLEFRDIRKDVTRILDKFDEELETYWNDCVKSNDENKVSVQETEIK